MIEVLHSTLFVLPGRKGYLCGGSFYASIKTCSVTRALLYGPRICRHITGSMVIETIYGLPGIGQLLLMAH